MLKKTSLKKLLICVAALVFAAAVLPEAGALLNNKGSQKAYAAIGGSGTAGDPYTIGTAADLLSLANAINAGSTPYRFSYLQLTADIDLSVYGSGYNGGKGWTPIGTITWYFSGDFNGNGYTITGLYINDPTRDYVGLFGYVSNSTLRNIALENVNINGRYDVGGIAGLIQTNTVITSCYVTGSVSGADEVGGIAGVLNGSTSVHNGGTVENCYVKGSVYGTSFAGGIAGRCFGGNVKACYATCEVSGTYDVGGIAGSDESGSVKDCVAINPTVAGNSSAGRVSGINNSGTLSNNYAVSLIKDKNGRTDLWANKAHNKIDGQDIDVEDTLTSGFWTGSLSSWDSSGVWSIEDGRLPILKNAGGNQDSEIPPDFKTSISAAAVTITPPSYTYTGSLILPAALTVVLNGKTLTENTDYTVSITSADGAGTSAGVKAGTVTLTITGAGAYKDTVTQTYTIVKANPPYTVPSGLTAIYGQKLSGVTLPEGWSWDNPSDLAGDTGEQVHKATFTPQDTDNYNTVPGVDITVTVRKLSFIVSINHSIGGMSATILIVSSEADLQGRSFTKQGFIFQGLYTNAEMTRAYDFTETVTENINLYAKWEKESAPEANPKTLIFLPAAALLLCVISALLLQNSSRRKKLNGRLYK